MRGDCMAVNKVVYGTGILIDLTNDTVTPDTLFKGCTAHLADGTIVTGTLFRNYPDEQCFYDTLQDLNGNNIEEVSVSEIRGKTVYRKV